MALSAFAEVEDLKARWPGFPVGQEDYAKIRLLDASILIQDLSGKDFEDSDEKTAQKLKAITCAMVKRSMQTGEEVEGAGSTQMTVGPFQRSWSYANPTGELYLTAAEKKRLGIGAQSIGSIRPMINRGGHNDNV